MRILELQLFELLFDEDKKQKRGFQGGQIFNQICSTLKFNALTDQQKLELKKSIRKYKRFRIKLFGLLFMYSQRSAKCLYKVGSPPPNFHM